MAGRLAVLREERLSKLQKLRELGINPYPSKVKFSLKKISDAREKMGKGVAVAGRIWSWREHGNVVFADISDESGKIQLFFQKKNLGEDFKTLKFFDLGDFIAVKGEVIKTQAGETTVDVRDFQLLTKSIRPLPSTWHGLKDVEERFRQRYVDLLLNEEVRELFKKKAIFWQSMRNFLIEKGFLEVETPVLETTAGGADANPFVTHHQALDINLYLRISMGELWQKRLMVQYTYLNSEQKDPAKKGPIIGYSIYRIKDEIRYPGYQQDPVLLAHLHSQGYKDQEVENIKALIFEFGSQWSQAGGVVKILISEGVVATSAPDVRLGMISTVVLNEIYGREWRENTKNIEKTIKIKGIDHKTAIEVITHKVFNRAPAKAKMPRLTLTKNGQTISYIPPNIVLDSDNNQIQTPISDRFKPYEAKTIERILLDILKQQLENSG